MSDSKKRDSEDKGTEDKAVTQPAPAKPAPDKVVTYIGAATRRIITREDWALVGADEDEPAEWNIFNGFKIPAKKFSDPALDYLKADGRFTIG